MLIMTQLITRISDPSTIITIFYPYLLVKLNSLGSSFLFSSIMTGFSKKLDAGQIRLMEKHYRHQNCCHEHKNKYIADGVDSIMGLTGTSISF